MSNGIKLAAMALIWAIAFTACQKEITYYTVTFDGNGGQVYEASMTVAEGDRVPYPGYTTPPEGYTQTGWFREVEAVSEWDFYSDVVTDNITLYAGWERLYTVTFHANGGTFPYEGEGDTRTERRTAGEQLMIPERVIKSGFVLEGWYTDEELTERWDFFTDVVTGDGDLYAKWGTGIEDFTLENYPRVDGATSTRALNNMIACKLLGLPYVWSYMSDTQEANVWPQSNFGTPDATLFEGRILTSQTHGAMMNLIEKKVDIILRSTTASPDEKAVAEAAGVTLIETPIALDAFVFLRNGANPVTSLTIEQIRKIYTGQITDWSQVGGEKAAIMPYTRPRNSGSEEAFRELVMGDLEPAEFPEEQQIFSMQGLFWEIERNSRGIGYIFKNYKDMIVHRYDEPVFAIEGVLPTPATMKDRTYPLTTKVYAIIRADMEGSLAYELYEWLQSDAAEVVLEECGFVPY